jgi:hypothetical protein
MDLFKICDKYEYFNVNVLIPLQMARSADQLDQSFKTICKGYGVEQFAVTEFHHGCAAPKDGFKICHTYPEAWIKRYMQQEYYRYDPVHVKPEKMPLPFFWDERSFDTMTHDQQILFDEAYSYGVINGTTIPLMPGLNRQAYFTALNLDITDKFRLTFALRMAAQAYSNIRENIERYLKNNNSEWI